MTKSFIAFVAVAVALISIDATSAQSKITEDRFQELMKLVVPAEQSKLIDWHPDLLSAQRVAVEQKKLIFIWSMDGHPLGCT